MVCFLCNLSCGKSLQLFQQEGVPGTPIPPGTPSHLHNWTFRTYQVTISAHLFLLQEKIVQFFLTRWTEKRKSHLKAKIAWRNWSIWSKSKSGQNQPQISCLAMIWLTIGNETSYVLMYAAFLSYIAIIMCVLWGPNIIDHHWRRRSTSTVYNHRGQKVTGFSFCRFYTALVCSKWSCCGSRCELNFFVTSTSRRTNQP